MTDTMITRPGYQLSYSLGSAPSNATDPLLGVAVALRRASEPLVSGETVFAHLGATKITLLPIKEARLIKTGKVVPLISARRGTPEAGEKGQTVRIDTAIWKAESLAQAEAPPASTPRASKVSPQRTRAVPSARHQAAKPLSKQERTKETKAPKDAAFSSDAAPQRNARNVRAKPPVPGDRNAPPKLPVPGARAKDPNEKTNDEEFREIQTIKTALDRIGALEARSIAKERKEPIVIAVIDQGFDDTELFNWREEPNILEVEHVTLPFSQNPFAKTSYDHGNRAASALRSMLRKSDAQYSVRRIVIGPTVPTFEPLALAKAIAVSVFPRENGSKMPPADVVLIPMSSGAWGTPAYLDAALTEAAKSGRQGKGAVIVCSTGDRGTNQGQTVDPKLPYGSAALGADELASHPDVLTAAPCDLEGRWLRTGMSDPNQKSTGKLPRKLKGEMDLDGRFGPSVTVSAPGSLIVLLDEDKATVDTYNFDGSSLASSLVAGGAVRVLQNNPLLSPREVRQLLKETAHVPLTPDRAYGAEAFTAPRFDRMGHNLKVGAGMVNVLSASLSAKDPVCQVLLRISEALPPPATQFGLLTNPALLIARWFDYRITDLAATNEFAEEYCKGREVIAKFLLALSPLREELEWLLRHLFAIFTHEGPNNWFSSAKVHVNHGALIRRLSRLAETLRVAMANERSVKTFASGFQEAINVLEHADDGSLALEFTLRDLFLGETRGTPRGNPRGISGDNAPRSPFSVLQRFEMR